MLTRRGFLTLGPLALAAGPGLKASGEQQAQPAALPPSIAALASMRDKARPIMNDERRGRMEKARRLFPA